MNKYSNLFPPIAHLLVVDESAEDRHLLTEMLRADDVCVISAASIEQASQLAVREQIDLIVMGGIQQDAFELERLIRSNPFSDDLPVLYLTTYKHLTDDLLARRNTTFDFLIKPFTIAQLTERVHALLKLSAMLREDRGLWRNDMRSADVESWEIVRRTKAYLERRLHKPARMSDLALALETPERVLAAAFQTCLNMSLAEYVRHARMRRAKQLLLHTTMNVQNIARAIGFSSAANFSTAFNTWVGTTPSSFRNQALNNALTLNRAMTQSVPGDDESLKDWAVQTEVSGDDAPLAVRNFDSACSDNDDECNYADH